MSTKPNNSEQSMMSSSANHQAENAQMDSTRQARRRMLLASLGKGTSLAAAAAVPMQSLAAIGTLSITADGKRCTVSGVGSAVHSMETVTAQCTGKSPTVYKENIANWPGYSTSGNVRTATISGVYFVRINNSGIQADTAFSAIFGSGSSKGIYTLLKESTTSDEAVWITALLNSLSATASSSNFPYTSSEVIGLYKDKTPQEKAAAVGFFRGYMQTVTS